MTNWLEITLPATPDSLDTLQAKLVAHGFDSFQIEDERDFEALRPGWDMADEALIAHYRGACRVIVYLPESEAERLGALRALSPGLRVETRAEQDWAEAWKQYYRPLPIGQRLLVQPAWLPTENPEGRCVFLNNPGMSFGTGLHASTRMCLELLEALPTEGLSVLDIGCGSGILSLCALTLGARDAVGIDIDPLATDISRQNAGSNACEMRYRAECGDFVTDAALRTSLGRYGLVFSNIVADVIIALAPLVGTCLLPGGRWMVSGIITPRWPEVLAAVGRAGFGVERRMSLDGWEAALLTAAS